MLEKVQQLGDLIIKHNAQNHLGICLLHKHFDLEINELLVETVTSDCSTILPTINADNKTLTAYMWKLHEVNEGEFIWNPLEFVTNDSTTIDQQKFVESLKDNQLFLLELSEKIVELNVQDIFGLALIHRQKIKMDRSKQSLLETDSENERMLKVTAVEKSRSNAADWTQTLWQFSKQGQIDGVNGCQGHGCAGHCGHGQEFCCY